MKHARQHSRDDRNPCNQRWHCHCWAEGQFYQHSRLLLGKAQKLLVPVNKINLHACNVAAAQAGIKEKNANGPVTQESGFSMSYRA